MFARIASNNSIAVTGIAARTFRTSAAAAANKKPSIGDAVTILQSKVSGINQVVSSQNFARREFSKTKINRKRESNHPQKTAMAVFMSHASICLFVD